MRVRLTLFEGKGKRKGSRGKGTGKGVKPSGGPPAIADAPVAAGAGVAGATVDTPMPMLAEAKKMMTVLVKKAGEAQQLSIQVATFDGHSSIVTQMKNCAVSLEQQYSALAPLVKRKESSDEVTRIMPPT